MKNTNNQHHKEKRKQTANDYKKYARTAERNKDFELEREQRAIETNDPSAFWKLINKSEDKTGEF